MNEPKQSKIVNGIHEVIGGPAPEGEDSATVAGLMRNPRAAIVLATGVEKINFMEPGEVFDQHIVGVTVINGNLAAVYNEQAVIGAIASTKKLGPMEAFDWFSSHRDDSVNELPAPIFLTDIRDVMV